MDELILKGEKAKKASYKLANLSSLIKDDALKKMSELLIKEKAKILEANAIDVQNAVDRGIKGALIDRLTLNEKRIAAMAEGLLQIAALPDPVGEVVSMWKRPNGLQIGQKRVPIGVVGMIYEARPNVTVDAAGLCIKSGNAVILRGGSEAINSNKAIISVIDTALAEAGMPEGTVQLIEDTSRETVARMMKLNKYIDVLIPRGGEGLINSVVQNSTVPVIQTGTGNCHVYVDGDADLDMAERIIVNAKTSRPGVCNAAETMLVDEAVAQEFLPKVLKTLQGLNVEIRGCERTRAIYSDCLPAAEEDWDKEYLDYILAVKVVGGIDEAIDHINRHGTKHSEAIVTTNYNKAQRFLNEIDAAAVYVNASTRFTDGGEFGFGAEIGISNQKLHARGPVGLKELTTIKYIIYGEGQIR
ncbi:glutamate-5-semialdehyde dehydrogenase [Clostridium thermosuccinogenes]|uniref:Gamma-glutamyl phosphate reductase n=1 Tax=Clostridium thermosuccinogenes TaxID=84032 RepID=A0A2K2FHB6_9CLOT|nr:glutamate-5-semialdehyde dehydrogenase [Pseudoclostridium thermosuccinogenes]AUS97470.1 glutamate-5-semialdehyde dehydrogenase [Pseudoclostridium thermosuccinogenes]PNT98179.1 glutamate-5-semialdehyde dehydrogenase [Pseudoclostridium thermosuccinogenes]PNU00328.1 glutamate-5-semialdehyde dehydrogenase [Pseudoclostridium thermosuccinogenes]